MDRLPHGYTNQTVSDGAVITKSYHGPDSAARCARETAVLRALGGRLPVPQVVGGGGAELRLRFVAGAHGQDLIDAGQADRVLLECGRALRRIHAIRPDSVLDQGRPQPGEVLVHGDYGPNNLLLDPATLEARAVLDWEWAHAGDRLEDMAWCEWIVRMHHPGHVAGLAEFFRGYGRRPTWVARQQAMLRRCGEMLDFCLRWEPEGPASREWRRRLAATRAWTE
jgi:aminoglycoside phosphotransferase (APT) family kinase protein